MKQLRLLAGFALLLSACGGSGGGDSASATGTLHLLATDAPFDHSMVEEARLTIDRVSAHRNANAESGFVTLYEDAPFEIDLAALTNGITRSLASGELATGTYSQFRVRLTGAYLRLINGREFRTEDGTLQLTSQATAGYKIFLDPGVEVVEGADETVVLDFDMTKTFMPVPANDPLGAQRFQLRPNVRAAVVSRTGEVRGGVTVDGGRRPGVVVYVMPPGTADTAESIASTATDASGSAAILGLEPGLYDVLAVADGRQALASSVRVDEGGIASFELAID